MMPKNAGGGKLGACQTCALSHVLQGMDDITVQIILDDDEAALWKKPHGDAVAARFRVELKRLGRHIHSHSGRLVEIRGPIERPDDGDFARAVFWRAPE